MKATALASCLTFPLFLISSSSNGCQINRCDSFQTIPSRSVIHRIFFLTIPNVGEANLIAKFERRITYFVKFCIMLNNDDYEVSEYAL